MVDTLCFLFLSSLPISVLRILDTEANKFYDRNHRLYDAALLTRCYTQHALRPFIDSETNHKQYFIKIPFINKGIEFIALPSIFKDRSVTSSIPTYFQNSEPPIICYKYNKPIRNTVFNFNKLISDLDLHANTPESWDCKDSKFIYPAAGHIMTGNLKFIADSRIRYIVSKGPKYRFFVCCLAHRGSTVGFLLLQCSSGVVRHPRDLQVSVATRFCRVLIFASS